MVRLPIRVSALVFLCLAALAASDPPAPPKEARRAFEKAAAALKAKHPDEAIRGYEQAVTLFPAYAEAWYELGKLRFDQEPDAARDAFEAAIRADPKYADPYLRLAILEYAAQHWSQLVDVTDRLLEIDAIDFPQAWTLNAAGHYNNRDLEAAEKSAREAERLDPGRRFPESWRLLGSILAQRGDFAGEAEQFREYLKLAPSGPQAEAIRANLAEAARRAGETGGTADSASSPTFRSETSLAVVRFQVRPNKGQPIPTLRPEDIEVREDGVAQKVAVFEGRPGSPRTVPVEISLLFDCSASVERIAAMSPHIFRESLLDEFPNASMAIYGFSDVLARFTRPTRDAAVLKKALDLAAAIPQRDTPLFGSIADTLRDAASTGAHVIRMLVIFSDGESTSPGDDSRVGEATRVAEESGTAIFPVMLNKPRTADHSMETVDSINEFMNLAQATGGKGFQGFMGTDVLPATLKALAGEMRSDYMAGFYVRVSEEQKRHRIEVVLRSKDRGRLYGGSRVLVH
jgi:VWFA-related protein